MSDRDEARRLQHRAAREVALEQQIRDMTLLCRKRAKRLYHVGMTLRGIILVCAFLAVLPDSSLLRAPELSAVYGDLTSIAGVVGGLFFILATNLRIIETMAVLNETVAYLEDQSVKLLACDGLSLQIAEIEIRKEIAAKEAVLQQGVFAGLDRFFGTWGRQGS